jgi:hypothetical protein
VYVSWPFWFLSHAINHSSLQDNVLPLSFPITGKDGKKITEVSVPKGTVLTMSIIGANRNEAVFGSDANEWKPDRWLNELPESVKSSRMPGIYSNMCVFP